MATGVLLLHTVLLWTALYMFFGICGQEYCQGIFSGVGFPGCRVHTHPIYLVPGISQSVSHPYRKSFLARYYQFNFCQSRDKLSCLSAILIFISLVLRRIFACILALPVKSCAKKKKKKRFLLLLFNSPYWFVVVLFSFLVALGFELMLARQSLFHLSHSTSPFFVMSFFLR
jgi:hypothetical protein